MASNSDNISYLEGSCFLETGLSFNYSIVQITMIIKAMIKFDLNFRFKSFGAIWLNSWKSD